MDWSQLRNPVPRAERRMSPRERATLLSGRLPAFCLGGPVGRSLPIFRFGRVNLMLLESSLVYLLENGYRCMGSDEFAAHIRGEEQPDGKSVLLCFDQARASVWTLVAPLLQRYGMRAVTFAIPGRIQHSTGLRPRWREPGHDPDIDHSQNPFCSWEELKALCQEGVVDVETMGWSHGRIFCDDKFEKLILPETHMEDLDWPMLSDPGEPLRFASPSLVFHPLLPTRSRMSDAYKHDVDLSVIRRIKEDTNAAPYLFRQHLMQVETTAERDRAIAQELLHPRDLVAEKTGNRPQLFCFPWGVCGKVADRLLQDSSYAAAFRRCRRGAAAWRPGQDRYRIQRLNHEWIRCLPGSRRKLHWRLKDAGI